MRKKSRVSRRLTAAVLACTMALVCPCLVSAEVVRQEDSAPLYYLDNTTTDGEITPYATNLIQAVSLNAHWEIWDEYVGYNRVYFTTETIAATEMDFIGFKRIAMEQFNERDPNSTWTEHRPDTWGQGGASNSPYYYFEDYMSVPEGYVYRVVVYHYAEKSTVLWFKDTQTYKNISSMMWP